MSLRLALGVIVVSSFFCFTVPTQAEAANAMDGELQQYVWSFQGSLGEDRIRSSDEDVLAGRSARLSFGYGRVWETVLAVASVDLHLGPYQPTHQERVVADFTGTGASLAAGYKLTDGPIRSTSGAFGILLGASYSDRLGRLSGVNDSELGNNGIVDYQVDAFQLNAEVGFFAAYLQTARPHGNRPELLVTRFEGPVFSLSVRLPLYSSYSVEVNYGDGTETKGKGTLKGYTLLASAAIFLGS